MPSFGKSGMSRTWRPGRCRAVGHGISSWLRCGLGCDQRLRCAAAGEPRATPRREQQLAELRRRLEDVVELLERPRGAAPARLDAQRRQQDLLDEPDLAVDGALEDAQVLGAQAELRQLGGGADDAGVRLRVALDAADLAAAGRARTPRARRAGDVGAGQLTGPLRPCTRARPPARGGRSCAGPGAPTAAGSRGCARARGG